MIFTYENEEMIIFYSIYWFRYSHELKRIGLKSVIGTPLKYDYFHKNEA